MLGESEHKVEKLWANVEYLNAGFEAARPASPPATLARPACTLR